MFPNPHPPAPLKGLSSPDAQYFSLLLETGSFFTALADLELYVDQASLKLIEILLPLLSKCCPILLRP